MLLLPAFQHCSRHIPHRLWGAGLYHQQQEVLWSNLGDPGGGFGGEVVGGKVGTVGEVVGWMPL